MKSRLRSLATLSVIAVLAATAGAQERDRSKIPDQYKWNLADIYPSDASWRAAKEAFAAEIPALEKFKGTLTSSPSALVVREPAGRPGHARQPASGDAAGDDAGGRDVRRGGRLRRP